MSKKPDLLDSQTAGNCGSNSLRQTIQNDLTIQDSFVEEHLRAGGTDLNVFKLLGIHEQGKLLDLVGMGKSISSGGATLDFPADNVFNSTCGAWRSKLKGDDLTAKGFIGYDFGPIYHHEDDRNVYGVDTNIVHHITTIVLTQGPTENTRASKIRVERSLDGKVWYGVDIVDLVNDAESHQYNLKGSAASRYWRLRPLSFLGGIGDVWEVNELQLMDYEKTDISNVQDQMGFMESRDRDYADTAITIQAHYDLLDTLTELNQFGWSPSGQNLYFTISFSQAVRMLGRPIVVGDIFEIPSEAQYSAKLDKVLKYMEVTDTAWSTEGYAPGWQPTLMRCVAEPMLSTQETLDISGHTVNPDEMGFLDIDDSNFTNLTDTTHRIESTAGTNVPERGTDSYEVASIPTETITEYSDSNLDIGKLSMQQNQLYIEDGMPPNGHQYTEGTSLPENATDEDYHRLVYTEGNVPTRLYRFSALKNRWIFCETDRRAQYNPVKPNLTNLIADPSAVSTSNVTGESR